ncbi:MAG: transglycosylase domain-containing protein [Oscillospiraceae bacterium]
MATTNHNGASSPAPAPRRRRKSTGRRVAGAIGKVLGTLLLVGICTCAIMACFAVVYVQTIIMPQAKETLSSIELFDVNQSSTMYYTDKNTGAEVEMLTLYGEENRVWVEYEDIPKNLINATVAIEDKRFYKHPGVDWIRTGYGVLSMFTGKDIQGGSTLTQQLIKNLTQNDEVTVKRKVQEIFTALEFEKTHTKEEILEWYLNYIYLGEGCNGVYTAALNYFGKELQDLTLAECASLISITNNPSMYNPYRYPENNLDRRDKVLYQMLDQGMISEEEYNAAKAEPLNLKREVGTSKEQQPFTWYEDQVINDVIDDLVEKYGITEKVATNLIYHGGLRIETCFDPEVQAYVDAVYNDRSVLELDSKTGQEIQSGITVIDNRTGNVVALAGGIGEKTESRIWNRATDTIRPPGSSIKPLAVYAPALDMGLITPATVFDDTPIDLDGEPWPKNSYGYYKGLTTVYEALEDSVNTIAVKVLRDLVTPSLSYQFLEDNFGITSLEPGRTVNGEVKTDNALAPLALGGLTDGVSTYEMAAAYATFANNGMYKEPRTYLKVTAVDTNGKETVLLENTSTSEAVLKESTVYYMNTMLQNVIKNGTGHDANFSGMTIAGKTGTTTSNNDKWFVGYSPYYTAAVWVGYDQQERIPSNSYLAAQLWRKVMEPLHANLEDTSFQTPENLVSQTICLDSGMIATDACALDPRGNRVTTMTFVNGDQPKEYCTVHTTVEVCTESSPILKYDGTASGVYHLAGEFCPEESVITIGILDYDRIRVNESVVTRDDPYLKSTLEALEDGSLCDVHTEETQKPEEFKWWDPSTWPTDDPNFDPFDRTTWPGYDPEDDPGDDSENPGNRPTDNPGTDPSGPGNEPVPPDLDVPPAPGEEDSAEDESDSSIGGWLNKWFNFD